MIGAKTAAVKSIRPISRTCSGRGVVLSGYVFFKSIANIQFVMDYLKEFSSKTKLSREYCSLRISCRMILYVWCIFRTCVRVGPHTSQDETSGKTTTP